MKDFPVIEQRVALDFLGESFICFLRSLREGECCNRYYSGKDTVLLEYKNH